MECEWKPCFSDNDGSEATFNENDKFCAKFGIVIRPVINTGGSSDYNDLDNKPSINGVKLVGNKTNEEIKIGSMTNKDIDEILSGVI